MNALLNKFKEHAEVFVKETEAQIEKGNKAAGTRARKVALEMSKLLKDFRKASVEHSKK